METDLGLKSTRAARQRVWLIMTIGCVLTALGLALLVVRIQGIMVFFSDFTHDYVSAQAFRDGRSIYVEFSQADLGAEKLRIAEPLYRVEPFTNIHPPFDALLFAPLTLLPYDQAVLAWSILSGLLFLAIGWIVLRELRISLAPHWCVLLLGLGLCWYPFQAHIALGQLSLLVVACLIGCWALLRQGRERLAGLLLGLACLIKLFPGLIILYLLLRRRWQAGGTALGTVALGSLMTLALVGPADMVDYFVRMAPQDSAVHGPSPINVALAGVIRRLLTDGPWVSPLVHAPLLATGLVAMISLGVLIVLLRHIGGMPPTPWNQDRAFALVCLAMLLISPITWWHVFPLLLLPLGLLLQDLHTRPDRWKLGLSLLALALVSLPDLEIARTLMGLYAPYRVPWFVGLLLALPTIGLMLLWWAVAYRPQAGDDSWEGRAQG